MSVGVEHEWVSMCAGRRAKTEVIEVYATCRSNRVEYTQLLISIEGECSPWTMSRVQTSGVSRVLDYCLL